MNPPVYRPSPCSAFCSQLEADNSFYSHKDRCNPVLFSERREKHGIAICKFFFILFQKILQGFRRQLFLPLYQKYQIYRKLLSELPVCHQRPEKCGRRSLGINGAPPDYAVSIVTERMDFCHPRIRYPVFFLGRKHVIHTVNQKRIISAFIHSSIYNWISGCFQQFRRSSGPDNHVFYGFCCFPDPFPRCRNRFQPHEFLHFS